MRRVVSGALVALLLAACAGGGGGEVVPLGEVDVDRPAPEATDDAQDLAAGLNDVGHRLLLTLPAGEDAVLSPLSIGLAFGMADVGAVGGPAVEPLAELFAYPVEGEERLAAFNTLQQSVVDVEGPTLRLANRLYPNDTSTLAEGFDETLATWFGARAEPLPLQSDPEGSRERINGWVADETEGLIPDLLPEGMPSEQTVAILVNALYLQADWAATFGKYRTEPREFTRLDGSTTSVPMLHDLEHPRPGAVGDGWVATTRPYEDASLELLLVVPDEGRYEEVRGRLAGGLVDEVDDALSAAPQQPVELWLPRFEASSDLDLGGAFEDLGATGIFGAEFPGVAPGVFLSAGVHSATVALDEQGTTAAAATALEFLEEGPPEPELVVEADRPFLWLVRHVPTGAVLFVGQVTDPVDPGPAETADE